MTKHTTQLREVKTIDRVSNWARALISGDYKKVRRYLRRDDQYCAWGVAVDLYSVHDWTISPDSPARHRGTDRVVYQIRGNHKNPHTKFVRFMGLTAEQATEVDRLNDNNKGFGAVISYLLGVVEEAEDALNSRLDEGNLPGQDRHVGR